MNIHKCFILLEMVYHFGEIKKSFKYENRNSLSKYYNRNDLINITFNFRSNVIDMSLNYYIKMPKSMLETTLIKTLDRYPEKLKIFEHNWMPFYNYLTLKYFGFIKKDVDWFIINYYLDNDWRENPPLTPNEQKKRFWERNEKNDDVLLVYEVLDNNVYLMFRMNIFTIYKISTIFNGTLVFNCNIIAF